MSATVAPRGGTPLKVSGRNRTDFPGMFSRCLWFAGMNSYHLVCKLSYHTDVANSRGLNGRVRNVRYNYPASRLKEYILCTTERPSVRIKKAVNIYIRRRRVPLAEVCCSIFENFLATYTNKIRQSSQGEPTGLGKVEMGGITIFPNPHYLEGWPSSKEIAASS